MAHNNTTVKLIPLFVFLLCSTATYLTWRSLDSSKTLSINIKFKSVVTEIVERLKPVSYTHLTLPTIYSV